jgi:hypothetical protein
VLSNKLSTISKQPVSSSEIARQTLVKFAAKYYRDVTPALAQIWADELSDIRPDLLQRACDQVAKTWTSGFMPTPANIRAAIDQANAKAFGLEAEEAWQRALYFCTRHFHPDMGVNRRAPKLPAAIEHAIRAAHGMSFIYNADREQLVWAKKRFIEDFTNIHETGQVKHLLTDGEARRLLRQIASGGPQSDRALPVGKTEKSASADKRQPTDVEVNQATEAARRKIFGGPIRDRSEADLADELRRQKAALIERGWLASGQPGQNPAPLSPVGKACGASTGLDLAAKS